MRRGRKATSAYKSHVPSIISHFHFNKRVNNKTSGKNCKKNSHITRRTHCIQKLNSAPSRGRQLSRRVKFDEAFSL